MPVMRNAARAIQFCGSAIVSVPTGGRKNTLRQTVAASDAAVDSTTPQPLAIEQDDDDVGEGDRRGVDGEERGVDGRHDQHEADRDRHTCQREQASRHHVVNSGTSVVEPR